MRLIRYGARGAERPGVLDAAGGRLALPDGFPDWSGAALAPDHLARVGELVAHPASLRPVPEQERWGAPVARPGKVVCIGLNYSDHAAESGQPIPTEPILFLKAANTVVGPFDDLEMPRGAAKVDWEVELGVVIGRTARYVSSPDAALALVAGYCTSHDVSERAFQLERGGQWTKGKSCDTFNPLGPWLATASLSTRSAGARDGAARERDHAAERQHRQDDLRRRSARALRVGSS